MFQYKVESSAVVGTAALEAQLNLAGTDHWELIVADDSGLMIYKKSSETPKLKYKVVQPPGSIIQPNDLQTFLQPFGDQGWELIVISVAADVVIFKQEA